MFKNFFSHGGILNALTSAIEENYKISVFGCGIGEKLAIMNCVDKFIFFVANNEQEANEIYNLLEGMQFKVGLIKETPNIELNDINNIFIENISILRKCYLRELDALVVVSKTLLYNWPSKDKIIEEKIEIVKSKKYDLTNFVEKLSRFGYKREGGVTSRGEFSVRGDIIDVFPISENQPYRIYFDFDEVESIKQIDTATFLSTVEEDSISFYPSNLLSLDKAELLASLDNIKIINNEINEIISKAKEMVELENYKSNYWFSAFVENSFSNIYDFLPENTAVYFSDAKIVYDNLALEVQLQHELINEGIKNNNLLSIHEKLKFKLDNAFKFNQLHSLIAFQSLSNANKLFHPNKVFNLKVLPTTNYNKNFELLLADIKHYKDKNFTILLYAKGAEGLNKISRMLDGKISYNICQNLVQAEKFNINILPKNYPLSFSFIEEKLIVIGTSSIFAENKKVYDEKIKKLDVFLPEAGDYVVHNHHGVGKCLGVKSLNIYLSSSSSSLRDYVVIEYKNNDKLYLPVENIDSISKFVGSDKAPTINKLGGTEFLKTKNKIKASLKEMAFNLIELYAEREQVVGYKYQPDDELMIAFEDSFNFIETPDQITAIMDIKKDMESAKVMDRLVCGDVGFGKTEVAIRCAFKTITNGRMVAFLCPTTILSEQHYNTALARMKQFGVSVEVLNRFKSNAQVKDIYEKLERGEIDLIIGTHKLLNKNIKFKNLGLLILDEEQKFGVEDKEKIKNLKKNINVLTLTATPIPRTLHMSLVGIRDISVIETPPLSRIPTVVSVTEYSDYLIKVAVEKELARAGQVLIIYNRVESIYQFASKITNLLGENVSIGVAHGQMAEKELENSIYRLYNGEIEVLIATTLIENGIDLPSANTLIVMNADMLGLSQLYQLKGRIGRSDRQAYAYFTYDGRKLLTENAYKRLQAITEFSSMGSGYKIALRDLEIRGAGNVLGKEQHGHLQKVGYAMYVSLLNQAVAEAKGEKVELTREVRIETTLNAYISADYIEKYQQRISAYMAISTIDSVDKLQTELTNLQDIYGDVPMEVSNLCKLAFIKNLASKNRIEKVVIKSKECYLQFSQVNDLINERISEICSKFPKEVVLKLDNLPIIEVNEIGDEKDSLHFLIAFLQEFV